MRPSTRARGDRNNVVFGIPDTNLEQEVSFIKDELQRRPVVPDVPVIEINTPALYTPPPAPVPIPLGNLAGWWDFSDLAYRTLHTGQSAQTYWKWADRSVSNMKLVTPNDNGSPDWYRLPTVSSINGVQSLLFDYATAGNKDVFYIDDGGPNTSSNISDGAFTSITGTAYAAVFMVVQFTNTSDGIFFEVRGANVPGERRRISVENIGGGQGVIRATTYNFNNTDGVTGVTNVFSGSAMVLTAIFSPTAPYVTVRLNGYLDISGGSTQSIPATAPKLMLGAGSGGQDPNIGEVLVYHYPLSDPEIFQVESYLAGKWGI